MDRVKMSNLYKGPSIDASYQVSVHLAEGFQRRLKCEKLTDAKRWQKLTLPLARWAKNVDIKFIAFIVIIACKVVFSVLRGEIQTFFWHCYFRQIKGIRVMVFNTTFNSISVISLLWVLLVEETRVPRENHQPVTDKLLSHNVVSSTPDLSGIRSHNISGDRH
jgi:hypothetical protein